MKKLKKVKKIECDEDHVCDVSYGNNLTAEVDTEGLLLGDTEKISYNGGVKVKLDEKTCKKYGEVLVCK